MFNLCTLIVWCVLWCAMCVQATPTVDWVALASILVAKSSSQDEFTRITALKWIKVGAGRVLRVGLLVSTREQTCITALKRSII
jgi:hypothetical protein